MKDAEENLRQLRVDELLEQIRKEARYLEQEENLTMSVQQAPLPMSDFPVWEAELEAFPMKDEYHVNEFLVYDDIEFVSNAFRGILQREPDESGLDGCTVQLRKHGDPVKYEVLLDLLESEEGRAHQVRIVGMRWARWERSLRSRWWFKNRLMRKIFDISKYRLRDDQQQYSQVTDQRHRRQQQKTSNYLAEQQVLLDYIRQREYQLEAEQGVLGQKMERYRSEALVARSDLITQQQRVNVLLDKLQAFGGSGAETAAVQAELATHADDKLDSFYLAFENECRGDEADIREQLAVYLPRVTAPGRVSTATPLLDIGSGRGEWLGLLRDNDVSARGVDISKVLVDHCRAQQLDVHLADAIEYLREQADNSLGAITSFHVIEHLPFDQLFSLVEECHRVLSPGGVVIYETPNPENVLVGSHTFYHDPTHRNPITPTLIDFLLRHLGFVDIEIERLHPYPPEARVYGMDPLTDRVNGAFCGAQDFAVIGCKPAALHKDTLKAPT
jgi:SAM-dependent methyltransferase